MKPSKMVPNVGIVLLLTALSEATTLAETTGFAGQRFDSESGLIYLRSRAYDPEAGTFLTKDPLGIAANVNMYCYCGSEPVNRDDPGGLKTYGVGIQGSGSVALGEQPSLVTTLSVNGMNLFDWSIGYAWSHGPMLSTAALGASGGFMLISPIIIWLITGIVFIFILFRSQFPLWRLRKKLRRQSGFRKREIMWSIGLLNKEENIFDNSDSPDIRATKQMYLDESTKLNALTGKLFLIPLIGFVLSIVAAIIEAIIRGIR